MRIALQCTTRVVDLRLGGCKGVSDLLLADIGRTFAGVRVLEASSRRRLGRIRVPRDCCPPSSSSSSSPASVSAACSPADARLGLSSKYVTTAGVCELCRLTGLSLVELDLRGVVVPPAGPEEEAQLGRSIERCSRLETVRGVLSVGRLPSDQ